MEISKEKRIKAEIIRLSEKFNLADANQREVLAPLLQNAAFMKVTLEDLQEKINNEGVVDYYQNGANQHGMKQSATLQSYNSLIKNYASVMKNIAQLVPYEKKSTPVWQPEVLTPEEETTSEEREQARREEINAAIIWQAEMKEREKAGEPYIPFNAWHNTQNDSAAD